LTEKLRAIPMFIDWARSYRLEMEILSPGPHPGNLAAGVQEKYLPKQNAVAPLPGDHRVSGLVQRFICQSANFGEAC
jgi:hypothetical protein